MGLYEGIKDVAKVVQQADNLELYQRLLDLSAQALDMQAEITRLKNENAELQKKKDIEAQIIRHAYPYITISGDKNDIKYCATCWDNEQKLIQMKPLSMYDNYPGLSCNKCKNRCRLLK